MKRGLALLLLALATAAFAVRPEAFAPLLEPFAPLGAPAIYPQAPLWRLALAHMSLVLVSVFASFTLGFLLAVGVTRERGRVFGPLARCVVAGSQCFPPVAVLSLLVPVLGFGGQSLFWALFLYGLFPVFENALSGLSSVSANVRESARGMGLTGWGRFWGVEVPLSLPLVVLGLRLTFVVSMSTATLGSSVGVSSLGEVIVAGLGSGNPAFVVQGAVLVTALAGLGWAVLGGLDRWGGAGRRDA